jgi:hypothetical protein
MSTRLQNEGMNATVMPERYKRQKPTSTVTGKPVTNSTLVARYQHRRGTQNAHSIYPHCV